jgi:hypothetical protein
MLGILEENHVSFESRYLILYLSAGPNIGFDRKISTTRRIPILTLGSHSSASRRFRVLVTSQAKFDWGRRFLHASE